MDGKTIVEFNEITTVESGDKLLGVDISDTSASAGGTNKHFTKGNLLKEYVTLVGEETLTNKTLTSPVITDIDITGGSATDIDITGGSISESTNVVEVLKKVYPVGCIYTSTVSTNPNTLFGFGTWSEYGQGRVLVGKSAEAEFNTAGKTGGLKENRQGFPWVGVNSSKFQDSGGSYTASVLGDLNTWLTGGGSSTTSKSATIRNVGGDIRTNGTTPTEVTHYRYTTPNLQPYIVVYFWHRTA